MHELCSSRTKLNCESFISFLYKLIWRIYFIPCVDHAYTIRVSFVKDLITKEVKDCKLNYYESCKALTALHKTRSPPPPELQNGCKNATEKYGLLS